MTQIYSISPKLDKYCISVSPHEFSNSVEKSSKLRCCSVSCQRPRSTHVSGGRALGQALSREDVYELPQLGMGSFGMINVLCNYEILWTWVAWCGGWCVLCYYEILWTWDDMGWDDDVLCYYEILWTWDDMGWDDDVLRYYEILWTWDDMGWDDVY